MGAVAWMQMFQQDLEWGWMCWAKKYVFVIVMIHHIFEKNASCVQSSDMYVEIMEC